ncbi:unnamed protein product [Urochloa decumbens]|uniref:Uncharacterized protein n=1 Tax=Urochloa decumbens TaxID=240449 RepID=A0ABC9EQU9_9POAL
MRTMTIPSATMRRLKQAAAAARAAAQAAAPAPVLRRDAGGDGGGGVHRPTSPSSVRLHTAAGARVRSNGRAPVVRANQPAPVPPVQASSNYSSLSGKRRATAPPPPSTQAGGGGVPATAPAVAVGDRLLVRTPVTNTLAGQHVVMTIGAVVVSMSAGAADEEEDGDGGYLEVILDGDFPPQDPSSTVRITRDQIVVTTPAAAATIPPAAASGAAASITAVPAPARLGKSEAGGSATSLRGAEERRSLQNAGFKRSRY